MKRAQQMDLATFAAKGAAAQAAVNNVLKGVESRRTRWVQLAWNGDKVVLQLADQENGGGRRLYVKLDRAAAQALGKDLALFARQGPTTDIRGLDCGEVPDGR